MRSVCKILKKMIFHELPPTSVRGVSLSAGHSQVVIPQKVSPQISHLNLNVPLPPYAKFGMPPDCAFKDPEIKDEESIVKMRNACRLAKRILDCVGNIIKPGITTDSIDKFVHDMAISNNAYPSPLNYRGFPKSVCTSVNNVVCHGIPDDRALLDGDIINVDVTVFLNGFHGDCSKTFLVGQVDERGQELVKAGEECLYSGIGVCGPGRPFSHIGIKTFEVARKYGFNVVPAFIGHGIGSYFHGPPDIYHFPSKYPGLMQPGMTFTIEPAISEGSSNITILKDGWTAITEDNSRSAQFEHTILITDNGVEILTA